jgi:hypothetical protein
MKAVAYKSALFAILQPFNQIDQLCDERPFFKD